MKKLLLGFALAGMAFGSSKAVTIYSDEDRIDFLLSSVTPLYDGIGANNDFDIVTDDADGIADSVGYTPGAPIIAKFGFNFTTFFGTYDVSYTLAGGSSGPILGAAAGTTFAVGGTVLGLTLTDLKADGILEYTVSWVSGSPFRLNTASLVGISVPDGGSTAIFLGSTLVGMAALARRKK